MRRAILFGGPGRTRTWTDKDLVARWYGPNVQTVIHRLDLAPDGLWLVERTKTADFIQLLKNMPLLTGFEQAGKRVGDWLMPARDQGRSNP
jgi:hypothetical protein